MTLPSLSRLGTGLAALCLAQLLAVPEPATATTGPIAVVIASTAEGYAAGDPVVDGAIRVPDGASLVLLLADGRLVEIDGFYQGSVEGPAPSREDRRGALLNATSVDESILGGARGVDGMAGPEDDVTVAAGTAVAICGSGGAWPALRRGPGLNGPLTASAAGAEPLEWPADRSRLPLPEAHAAEGPIDLRDSAGHIVARVVPRPLAPPADLADALTALAGAGCRQQSEALAVRLRDQTVGLDLTIGSDRGRRPRYRVGEAIRLVVRVNRPSHVHCLLRDTDGGRVPIYPPAGSVGPVMPETAVEIPDDALPMRLSAAPPTGITSVRCIAILPPPLDALPLAAPEPGRLNAGQVSAMEQALAALPMDRWTADTLSVEVVE